ncbi:LPS O-antigen chain length determinant protein WzzB [Thiopseudomonas acetoxidans]|uniref:Wzz/FepE/Etk N-terminal domain-containing protein n=1 Tax=Thiopseudomonas acetoxidans TaxID=3041622 RepID=A0ABT7SMQ0_9GAMM|nr:Wzz/FepE/Etk N-terminal domain-containing protein [Thiopseudomonas sp. CY1220]MDM7857445.1 Wzz/FepE/Etk N-terminal domain-containing protein [Thiopseudomonas sp. CY1220]
MSSNIPVPHMPNNTAPDADEIDLFELFQSIWQEKILIVIITAVVTGLALFYALAATPIYQTQATLVPPPAYAIQGYNEGRMEAFRNTGVKELTANEVYSIFKTNLNSSQLRNAFFEEVYLPSLSAEQQKNSRESLLKTFNRILSVKQGDAKTNPNLYLVSAELDNPTEAADWVKQYIARAITAAKLEIENNIEAEQRVHIDALTVKTNSLLAIAKREREDQVNLLKEALYIAESIGLENKASLGGNRYIDNDLIYTRGAKTLRAQLDVLQKRTSDEPFIAGFRELNTQLELLRAYKLDDTNVSVVTIDEAAEVPATPIKPNKKLIVAIGIVLGGMLGVFAALIRSAIRKRKNAL